MVSTSNSPARNGADGTGCTSIVLPLILSRSWPSSPSLPENGFNSDTVKAHDEKQGHRMSVQRNALLVSNQLGVTKRARSSKSRMAHMSSHLKVLSAALLCRRSCYLAELVQPATDGKHHSLSNMPASDDLCERIGATKLYKPVEQPRSSRLENCKRNDTSKQLPLRRGAAACRMSANASAGACTEHNNISGMRLEKLGMAYRGHEIENRGWWQILLAANCMLYIECGRSSSSHLISRSLCIL